MLLVQQAWSAHRPLPRRPPAVTRSLPTSRSGKAVKGAAYATGLDMADTVRVVEAVNGADVTIIAVSAGRDGQDPQPVIDAYRALIAAQPGAAVVLAR